MNSGIIAAIFPFLKWFKGYSPGHFRHDIFSGLTVALVLIPQSMAYAQLAGLPAYYGLYAALLPPIVASLFGSSRQLATGPVAIVSLMTATALQPLAKTGSESFIAYAILLALLVGLFQFILGVVKLGVIVNFLSHPVVSGFSNAAAIIIATSQLSKLFGVRVDQAEHHYKTIYMVIREAFSYTHWPTMALAILAFAIMIVLRRINPRIPNVLLAVVITTVISYFIGFEKIEKISINQIDSSVVEGQIVEFNNITTQIDDKATERIYIRSAYDSLLHENGELDPQTINLEYKLRLVNIEMESLGKQAGVIRSDLRHYRFTGESDSSGAMIFSVIPTGNSIGGFSGSPWHLQVGNNKLAVSALKITSGGAVVGNIPQGLPAFSIPILDTSVIFGLLPMAMIISLLGFMEAISIAKAMATRTGQRLDVNQELIGQGMANICGAFGQSYAVSGSFSRSAVNIQAGAVSGLSNVFSSIVVVIVLLFFTPLLYHLPQSVLAAIIMVAVVGLLNLKSFIHAWRAQWYDGTIGIITFVSTLLFAPHLERGIIIGVVLSLVFYLARNMKPTTAMLSLHPSRTFRNRARFDLKQCPYIAVIRYGGSLIFSNVSYLENQVIETVRSMPELRHVLIVSNGINELDASGVDALSGLIDHLHGQNIEFSISGTNDAVMDVLKRTGLKAKIGDDHIFYNIEYAIENIWDEAHSDTAEEKCPLHDIPLIPITISKSALEAFKRDGLADEIKKHKDKTDK